MGPAAARSFGGQRVVGGAVPRSGGYVRVAPRVIGPRGPWGVVSVVPSRYYRPYYSFRPRVSLGFGLWVGYPVVYPYFSSYPYVPYGYGYGYGYGYDPYYNPYGYSMPYPGYPTYSAPAPYSPYGAYGAPGPGSVGVQPGAATGGLSFEISPPSAEIFVDGNYSGVVSSFTPTSQPLTLAPGLHHVEIRAPGYETQTFDVDVVAGQVIPYQGTMQPVRP
jgi:hypothetical protein